MYEAKIKIYVVILIMAVLVKVGYQLYQYETERQAQIPIKEVTVGSDVQNILPKLSNKTLDCGAKVIVSNLNWDMYLSREPLEDYKNEKYVSPIVAIYDQAIWNNSNTYQNENGIRVDLMKLIDGAVAGETFQQIYPKASSYSYMDQQINVVLDKNYEKEIRQVLLMQITNKDNPTSEDYAANKKRIDEIWDKLEKVPDAQAYLEENDYAIVITAEYNVLSGECPVSFSPTVGINMYMNYKDGYEEVAQDIVIMKKACIRQISYNGVYRKSNMKNTDWTLNIVPLNEDIFNVDNLISTEEKPADSANTTIKMAEKEEADVTTGSEISQSGQIEFMKMDEDGKTPLENVEFEIYNSENELVDTVKTDRDGKATTKVLPYGNYTAVKKKTENGYVLNEEVMKFTLNESSVVNENTETETPLWTIIKKENKEAEANRDIDPNSFKAKSIFE